MGKVIKQQFIAINCVSGKPKTIDLSKMGHVISYMLFNNTKDVAIINDNFFMVSSPFPLQAIDNTNSCCLLRNFTILKIDADGVMNLIVSVLEDDNNVED